MRVARIIGIKKEYIPDYKRKHEKVPCAVTDYLRKKGIRNYSIFNHGEELFSYFECEESEACLRFDDYLRNPVCADWESKMKKMQKSVVGPGKDILWVPMEEIWHME
jgi:L-rhamnose mutarotase